jgi:hypothetical protein
MSVQERRIEESLIAPIEESLIAPPGESDGDEEEPALVEAARRQQRAGSGRRPGPKGQRRATGRRTASWGRRLLDETPAAADRGFLKLSTILRINLTVMMGLDESGIAAVYRAV